MELADILRHAVHAVESAGIPYMIVGSIASMAYGEPRFTLDMDLVIAPALDQVGPLCDAFPPEEYYVSTEAARIAVAERRQFNVIHVKSGNKIDFLIARDDPWGKSQLERRRRIEILPGLHAFAAAPEDVILAKMWYYREGGSEKHLRDIAAMLQISGDQIDRDYIAHWAGHLGLSAIWQTICDRLKEEAPQ